MPESWYPNLKTSQLKHCPVPHCPNRCYVWQTQCYRHVSRKDVERGVTGP